MSKLSTPPPQETLRDLTGLTLILTTFNSTHHWNMAESVSATELPIVQTTHVVDGTSQLPYSQSLTLSTEYLRGADEISRNNARVLARTGLEVSVDHGELPIKDILQGQMMPPPLKLPPPSLEPIARLTVGDTNTFISFLEVLRATDITTPQAHASLTEISDSLLIDLEMLHIAEIFGVVRGLDRALTNAEEICEHLFRLNVRPAADRLDEALSYSWRGGLPHYLYAERSQLLPRRGVELHDWHNHLTPEAYLTRWKQTLKAYGTICNDPQGAELRGTIHRFLNSSVEEAQRDITRKTHNSALGDYWQLHSADFLSTLSMVQQALDFYHAA